MSTFVHLEINDSYDYATEIKVAHFSHHVLETGKLSASITHYQSPTFSIGYYSSNIKMIQTGYPIQDNILFFIPLNTTSFTWRQHQLKKGTVGIIRPNTWHHCILPSDFEGLFISISPETIRAFSMELNDSICKNNQNEVLTYNIKDNIEYLDEWNKITKTDKHNTFNKPYFDQILNSFLNFITKKCKCSSSKLNTDVHFKAITYVFNNLQDTPSITQTCKYLSISDRTLRNAFQQHVGISPKKYFKALFLNQIRKGLKDMSQNRIVDIANEWGFWHIGQFAKDYRVLFNELPSKTIQKLKFEKLKNH